MTEKCTLSLPNLPTASAPMFYQIADAVRANKNVGALGSDHTLRVGTDSTGRTLGRYAYSDIRRDEIAESADARTSRRLVTGLKVTGIVAASSLVTLLVGYLVASRWYDNRIVNPYAAGGFGMYGI